MRRTRIVIAFLLLFALLLSSCGQAAPEGSDAEDMEMEIPDFRDLPAVPDAPQEGAVTPVRVENTLFRAKFEGSDVSGSGEAVDGVYRFIADKTDGEAWHVKLECNYPTVAGRDYFVTYRFRSDVEGTVKFGDFQEFPIKKGENSVTGIMIATGGTSYFDLQLGMLPAFTIDFTEIEVEEYADEVEYEDALPSPVNFEKESVVYEKHDQGYGTILVRNGGTVNVNYLASPWDPGIWRSRLYIKTGLIPQAGVRYHITADAMCDQDMPFEVLFNNGDEEKGYGALYDQKLKAGEVKRVEAVVSGSGDGDELVIQFSLGEAPEGCQVIVGNLHVEIIRDHYTGLLPADFALDTAVETGAVIDEAVPGSEQPVTLSAVLYSGTDTVYAQNDDGYDVSYMETATSATLHINKAPENADDRGVWKVRLYADTGVELQAGTSYRVRYDLSSTANQEYEVCFDGETENAYGALYGRRLRAGGTDHVERIFTPDAAHGPLTLRLQLGKTDSAAGNTVTLSNLTVETIQIRYSNVMPAFSYETNAAPQDDSAYKNVLPEDFSYSTGRNVYDHNNGAYTQSVTASGRTATLSIDEAPSEGRDLWNSGLLINTGFTPEAGKKYAVSYDIVAEKTQPVYEVCFDGSEEKAYGALYGQSLTAGASQPVSYRFTPDASHGPLVLRFQLGQTEDTSGNVITVSGLKIQEVTTSGQSEGAYKPVEIPGLTATEAHEGGYEQSVNGTSLVVTKIPAPEPGVWQSKLFVDTQTVLEAGTKYRVTAKIKSDKAFDFEICYNNGDAEKGYGALYGQSFAEGAERDYVCEFDVPSDATPDKLILQLMVGKTPAGNTVSVNSVKLEKYVPEHEESTEVPGEYQSVTVNNTMWETHDEGDYDQGFSDSKLTVYSVPASGAGVWRSKLFIDTHVTPEAGAKYRVTANLSSANAFDFEICYNNGDVEKGYGALYGQYFDHGTFTGEFTAPADGDRSDLVLQIQLGLTPAPNTVTVSGITLEKWVEGSSDSEMVPGAYEEVQIAGLSAWDGHDDGYDQSISGTAMTINSIPSYDNGIWQSRLYVDTGKALEAGKKYKVTTTIGSNADVAPFEILFNNGGAEKGYGAIYEQSIAKGEEKTFEGEFTVDDNASAANLILQFQLGKIQAGTTFSVKNVTLEKWETSEQEVLSDDLMKTDLSAWAPVHQWTDAGYAASLSNTASSATASFSAVPAADDRSDWKVKLFVETGARLAAGKFYRIRYDIEADSEFAYNVFYNGAEEKEVGEFYGLKAGGKKTVEHVVSPANNAELVIQLMIGMTDAPNNVTVSNVQVDEITGDIVSPTAPVNSFVHEDYEAALSNTGSSASIAITKVPHDGREPWKVKLFAETGARLKAGKTYRVSIDVQSTVKQDYEITYNNFSVEKELGALYGLTTSTSKQTVRYTMTPGKDSELVIQLSLGKAAGPNTVTISGIKVEEINYVNAKNVMPDFRFDSEGFFSKASDEGYVTSLEKGTDSAAFRIEKAPEERNPWNVKLFVGTGVTPAADKAYRVSFIVDAARAQQLFEVFFDGKAEQAYGALFEQNLAAGKNAFSYLVMPAEDGGELKLQLRFGKTDGTEGNSYSISGVTVEEVDVRKAPEVLSVCTLALQPEYNAELETSPERAAVRLIKTPAEGREAWKNKLFVNTGVALKAGEKYRISMNVKSIVPAPFEVCFNNGDVEKGLGAMFGLISRPVGQYVEYAAYVKQDIDLVIQLSLGNCTTPNSIILDSVKVEKAGKINLISDTIYTF
ncbi:MAG: hypothetical protein IJL72_07425 [Lachnospiraceae bacterium]|nr:hypothetical protein [Lachnospiraceae bacterium]